MKWKEKSSFDKVVTAVMLLSALIYLFLSVLNLMDVADFDSLSDLCFSIFWLCNGLLQWKQNRKMAIMDFVLAAVWLLLAVLWLFP